MTQIAQCALEWWRASGPRSEARLLELVAHFARTNGQLDNLEWHNRAALADVKSWEKQL